jgi:gas vesicle protein
MNHRISDVTHNGFAMGVLLGAAVGAGLALLFAPKPGAQLRGDLGRSMTTLRDGAARRLRTAADRTSAGLSGLSASVGGRVKDAKDAVVDTARDMADSATSHARPDGRARV